jgi:hypothetical protein
MPTQSLDLQLRGREIEFRFIIGRSLPFALPCLEKPENQWGDDLPK